MKFETEPMTAEDRAIHDKVWNAAHESARREEAARQVEGRIIDSSARRTLLCTVSPGALMVGGA